MIEFDINYADEFVKEFDENQKLYPNSIKQMIKRYKKWKKRKDIFWDNDKANDMLYFTETFLKHAKGRGGGHRLCVDGGRRF